MLNVSIPRFIPTCVGNAGTSSTCRGGHPVHPHVCGERIGMIVWHCLITGSSPRVWGTRTLPAIRLERARFIPTCVGNAREALSCRHEGPVHPHVCGERGKAEGRRRLYHGSSPRVWGTRFWPILCRFHPRFIPTCVGNAPLCLSFFLQATVHPHVCGERHIIPPYLDKNIGSSPRVWGTPR